MAMLMLLAAYPPASIERECGRLRPVCGAAAPL